MTEKLLMGKKMEGWKGGTRPWKLVEDQLGEVSRKLKIEVLRTTS